MGSLPQEVRLARAGLLLAALLLAALVVNGCATQEGVERCREDTLPGAWQAEGSSNVWIFHPDGKLSCEGLCRFTATTGEPVAWAPEPSANVWSRPHDYIKLTFAKASFDGVMGSFQCYIEEDGARLRLQPSEGPAMIFMRQ